MSYLLGKDVSQWNNYAPGSEDFVMIKMSGGDAGLYFDSKASANYYNASKTGKVVGGYHFAGGSDPVAEADYFLRAMSPLAVGDLMALDWEIQHADPVGWCLKFVTEVHNKTGVWPLLYINISTCNTYDWSPVLANCGLWLAAPSISYDANAPIHHPYVMQQGPIVGGIDQDAFFGTREQLLAYGYHAPAVAAVATAPAPTPPPSAPAPAPQPAPATEPAITSAAPTTVSTPVSTSPPAPQAAPTPVVVPSTPPPKPITTTNDANVPVIVLFIRWLKKLLHL